MVQWYRYPIGNNNDSLYTHRANPGLPMGHGPAMASARMHTGWKPPLKLFASLLLVFLMAASNAAEKPIYKTVDADGNTVFTDLPPKEGHREVLTLGTPNVFVSEEAIPGLQNDRPSAGGVEQGDDPRLYRTLRIVSPANNKSIRGNDGSVQVGVDVEPGLINGHKLRLLLDGVRYLEGASTSFMLNNLERGEHTLQVDIIVHTSGQVLQSSERSVFNLQRYTQLTAPNQDQPTPLPKVVHPPQARPRPR